MRSVWVVLLLTAFSSWAQEREARFEVSEVFLRSWARDPVASLDVSIDCPGPVHSPDKDCEIHVGALLLDPSISDFQHVVIEPPNLCKHPVSGGWRSRLKHVNNLECVTTGFLRAWPEHLENGTGCSNPKHFLEVHPALTLSCGANHDFDFTPFLAAHEDLGFKPPTTARKMLGMKVWVCRGCTSAEGVSTISFDYCFGKPCKAGQASNFGRFQARILRSTIRPTIGKTLDGFATVIARVRPQGSTSGQFTMLKLYALEGTAFYNDLLAQRGKTGNVPTWDILGIFAIDPFSVLRTIEDDTFADGEWTAVPHPVTLAVFGRL